MTLTQFNKKGYIKTIVSQNASKHNSAESIIAKILLRKMSCIPITVKTKITKSSGKKEMKPKIREGERKRGRAGERERGRAGEREGGQGEREGKRGKERERESRR